MVTSSVVFSGLRLAPMTQAGADPIQVLDDAEIHVEDGAVVFVGPGREAPDRAGDTTVCDMGGRLALPGFVACHNAVLWVGQNDETAGKDGASYRTLTHAVCKQTSETADDALLETARARLARLRRSGVTAYELKSGFGASPGEDLRLARLCRRLQSESAALARVTLQTGQALCDDADPDASLEDIVTKLVPDVRALNACDAVEVFCDDEGGLDLDQASTILEAFYKQKTPSRVGCDRFCDSAAATLPASFYSRAATYLCKSDDTALRSIADTGTTMILTPDIAGLRGEFRPDVDAIRAAGGRIAVSCEAGPAGSGELDILRTARAGVSRLGLSESEALLAITTYAAMALGVEKEIGTIEVGKRCDLALFDAERISDLFRGGECVATVTAGRLAWRQ